MLDELDTEQVEELLADKAFDRESIRELLRKKGIKTTVPGKRNRRVPILYDVWSYKGRHLIENVFADMKEFRGIATRYHKLASTFCGGMHLMSWHLGTRGRKSRSSKYLES